MLGKTWRALRAIVALALAWILLAVPVRVVWANADSDDDGISDCRERAGLRTVTGAAAYVTDPERADTDRDGVSDADEIGPRSAPDEVADHVMLLWDCRTQTYDTVSDPSKADSDYDGLADAIELSDGSNVFAQDTDSDGLRDDAERKWGSDPNEADTDGDGFRDVEDIADGLSPVVINDVEDREAWHSEYAEGLYYGDAHPVDSVPQLMGSLSGSASSAIPFIGWVTGTAADLRDVVSNSMRGDWTAAGMSGAGLVPYVGDAARSVSQVSVFVAKNPLLVSKIVDKLATWERIPEAVRTRLVAAADKDSFDRLGKRKLSAEQIIKIAKLGVQLKHLAHLVDNASTTEPASAALEGEAALADAQAALRTYLRASSGAPVSAEPVYVSLPSDFTFPGGRFVDACTYCEGGTDPGVSVLHFAKVGSQFWSETLRGQVEKDAALVQAGYAIEWNFYAGPTGFDIDPRLVDALADAQIPYVVHLPA